MGKTLPMIIHEAESLTNAILDAGGEITPELDSMMAMQGKELREKLDSYGYVIDGLKMRQEYAIQRMKEWEKVASQCDKGLDSITERIKEGLLRLEIAEVHGLEYTFRIQANPPSVIIDNEDLVPEEFKSTETKVSIKISKKEILEALKSGKEVPGARATRTTKLVSKVSQRKDLEPTKAVERI